MPEEELARGFLRGQIDRRTLIQGLLAAGLSFAGASAFAEGLGAPLEAAEAAPLSSTPTVSKVSPSSGPTDGGTEVTVTGTHLRGATAVHFGPKRGKIAQEVSPTELVVTSPAGSGTVNITVTTAGGTSAKTAKDHFSYVAAPTVTHVSPSSGPAAGGTEVTVTGTHLRGASAVHFGPNRGEIVKHVSSKELVVTSPPGTGAVNVTVTTPGGTSAKTANDHFTYALGPTVTDVSPSSGPEAGGTEVTVTGTELAGATSVHFGANTALINDKVSSKELLVTSPAGTGTVDVTVTTAQGTSPKTAKDHFTYAAVPTVTGLAPSSGPEAGGTSVSVDGTNLTGATSVQFGTIPAVITNRVSSSELTVTSPAGTGTVDVTVTTPGGTSAENTKDLFTYTAPPPTPTPTPTPPTPPTPPPPTPVCSDVRPPAQARRPVSPLLRRRFS